jgi:hypothetical protein
VSELAAVITAIGETKEGDTITLDFVGGNTLVPFDGVDGVPASARTKKLSTAQPLLRSTRPQARSTAG